MIKKFLPFLCIAIISVFYLKDPFINASEFKNGATFVPGSGALYKMEMSGVATDISIYVADHNSGNLDIEYYFSSLAGFKPIEIWQQFRFKPQNKDGEQRAELDQGWILSKELKGPRRLPKAMLKGGAGGPDLMDFVLSGESQARKVATEMVKIPAGETKAFKFLYEKNGQKIEYWVSPDAKPMGLVKLISTGEDPKHQYKLTLQSLLKNVKAKIKADPAAPELSPSEKSELGL